MELNKKLMVIAITCSEVLASICYGQQVKYWVAFKDKQGTPYNISTPSAFLGPKAVSRRKAFYIPVHISDLPVTPTYVNQVENVANVKVLYSSKWLNGVVISLDSAKYAAAALSQINSFAFVNKSEKV